MESVHYLNEAHILTFLIQIFVLLSCAKALGALFMRFGYPAIAGEIITGIILGPTLLGRVLPGFQTMLFPMDLIQQNMLETVSWFGVLFLLLVTGFEVSTTNAVKQGKAAVSIGFIGVVVPFIIGVAVFWQLPGTYYGEEATQLTFSLFLATAASISALAIIARVLHDLKILKSDLGITILSGYVINDLLGWTVFSIVLGLSTQHGKDLNDIAHTLLTVILFGSFCLTLGSRGVGAVTAYLKKSFLPHPATILSFITCVALLCGAITQWLGIHAILGFFLAGVMAGNTPHISEGTREIITQVVYSIFVPIFFASIGLRVDFITHFRFDIVLLFLAVAVGGKFIGAALGAKLARISSKESVTVGIAFIPGGEMEIILAMLAMELKLINQEVFVAIVFAALFSSIVLGPLLGWSIRRLEQIVRIGEYIGTDTIILSLASKDRWGVIKELCRKVSDSDETLDYEEIEKAVCSREKVMGTGLEKGLAVPHGRLRSLKAPVIALGRSPVGIDWDARDGLATHTVFLVLTPEKDEGIQVQILAAIARCVPASEFQSALANAETVEAAASLLHDALNGTCSDN